MDHFIINRDTYRSRISFVTKERWDAAIAANHLFTDAVDLFGGDSRFYCLAQFFMNLSKDLTSFPH